MLPSGQHHDSAAQLRASTVAPSPVDSKRPTSNAEFSGMDIALRCPDAAARRPYQNAAGDGIRRTHRTTFAAV